MELSHRQKLVLAAWILRLTDDDAARQMLVADDESGQRQQYLQGLANLLLMAEEMEFIRDSRNDTGDDEEENTPAKPWLLPKGAVIRRIRFDLAEAESSGALHNIAKMGIQYEFRFAPALGHIAELLSMVDDGDTTVT
jgi:hypothetical protein